MAFKINIRKQIKNETKTQTELTHQITPFQIDDYKKSTTKEVIVFDKLTQKWKCVTEFEKFLYI